MSCKVLLQPSYFSVVKCYPSFFSLSRSHLPQSLLWFSTEFTQYLKQNKCENQKKHWVKKEKLNISTFFLQDDLLLSLPWIPQLNKLLLPNGEGDDYYKNPNKTQNLWYEQSLILKEVIKYASSIFIFSAIFHWQGIQFGNGHNFSKTLLNISFWHA